MADKPLQKETIRILVIDDEKGMRDLLEYELKNEGYAVFTAATGQEALETIRKEKISLVISDLKMPKMDGLEVLKAVKKIDPRLEVILATGYATVETAVNAIKMGAYDFVQKPFNISEVLALVEKALEKSELKNMVALYETSKAVHSTIKLQDLLPILIDLSINLLKADDVCVMLSGPDKKLYIAASHGLEDPSRQRTRISAGQQILSKVPEPGRTSIVLGGSGQAESLLLCPLLSKTEFLGVLCAARTRGEVSFDEMDQRYADVFASQISQAFENANLYRELEIKIETLNQTYEILSEMQKRVIQSEKLAAVGELAAGVAHELNNPLTTVIGLTDLLLEDEKKNSEKWDDLNKIKEQSARCGKIIANLLQFARQHHLEKKPERINEVVEKALELTQYQLETSGTKVVKDLDPSIPPVKLNSNQMQQVFINIIANAGDALKGHPKPKLFIKTEKIDGKVKISFTDNGCGIPDNIIGKIFDPFFTTKEVGKGTGLGLSISYGIVHDHGGETRVESKENAGTTFHIELPLLNPSDFKREI